MTPLAIYAPDRNRAFFGSELSLRFAKGTVSRNFCNRSSASIVCVVVVLADGWAGDTMAGASNRAAA